MKKLLKRFKFKITKTTLTDEEMVSKMLHIHAIESDMDPNKYRKMKEKAKKMRIFNKWEYNMKKYRDNPYKRYRKDLKAYWTEHGFNGNTIFI